MKRKRLSGVVEKVIQPIGSKEPEKAQIAIDGADDLYREIRIENRMTAENGENANLNAGERVDVTLETKAG